MNHIKTTVSNQKPAKGLLRWWDYAEVECLTEAVQPRAFNVVLSWHGWAWNYGVIVTNQTSGYSSHLGALRIVPLHSTPATRWFPFRVLRHQLTRGFPVLLREAWSKRVGNFEVRSYVFSHLLFKLFKSLSWVIMLKEHSFNTVESQQCCNELRCAKDVKRVVFMTCGMCICRNGRADSVGVGMSLHSWISDIYRPQILAVLWKSLRSIKFSKSISSWRATRTPQLLIREVIGSHIC
jgi:hypothetical protein